MLGEVVASARALTGACYGVVVTLDETGAPRDPVFPGLSPEKEREPLARPETDRRFEHPRTRPGPADRCPSINPGRSA